MKLKKLLALILACSLLFGVLSACGSSSGSQSSSGGSQEEEQETYTLKLGTYLGTSHLVVAFFEYYANEIETRTDGRVKVEVYPGSMLVPNGKELDSTIDGTCDIGHTSLTATPGRFPVMEATTLYYPQSSAWAMCNLRQDFYNEFQPEELDDVKVLLCMNSGPNMLHFEKNTPVTTELDFTGLKMRAVGAVLVDFVNDNGGAAQSIALGEIYDSLDKGIINSLCQTIEALESFSLYDFIGTSVRLPISAGGANALVMNKEVWDSFPQDIKDTIDELNEEMMNYCGYVWTYPDLIAEEKFVAGGGVILDVPEDEQAAYIDYAEQYNADYHDLYPDMDTEEYISFMQERAEYYEANPVDPEVVIEWVEANVLPLKG